VIFFGTHENPPRPYSLSLVTVGLLESRESTLVVAPSGLSIVATSEVWEWREKGLRGETSIKAVEGKSGDTCGKVIL
jgi:hypothetical protein